MVADQLSWRQQINSEWTLSHQVLHHLWRLWGQPHIDLFAMSETTCLPMYVSSLPDPAVRGTNASSSPWTDLWTYMFPPFPLIPDVLQQIQTSNYQAILIAPAWPSQPWFPRLLSLLDNHPRCLLPLWMLLRQPQSQIFHPDPQCLCLHTWKLSNQPSSNAATPRRWQPALPHHIDSPHNQFTTASGVSSLSV